MPFARSSSSSPSSVSNDLARLALEQRLAELIFQLLNGTAQRGLREMQLLRRTGEVLVRAPGRRIARAAGD